VILGIARYVDIQFFTNIAPFMRVNGTAISVKRDALYYKEHVI
jgi:hypothetical protein